ncbi:hypothetical protein [Salinisphaera sp.]|uniref:hypothetical protein n=1 Tax=Salinisphaera sp. TaxID=1914330 RepID=UPI002D78699E|nr:hypothetical protein [Salinisphaera sp.]HET7315683.1 hypothetical protein [Salinisphaera sp.]
MISAGPESTRRPAASAGDGAVLIMALLALGAAMLVARVLPLGASEAAALGWLQAVQVPGTGWGEPFRHLVARGAANDQPMVALVVAALLAKAIPFIDTLFALRLPDVLAAGLVAGGLVRCAETRALGVLAAIVFVASPALWAMVVGPPGLMVDAGAALLLYESVRAAPVRSRSIALIGAVVGLGLLIANGAGVYAIAAAGGAYLHTGFTQGEWRLAGNLRVTVLAALSIAGLTLTDVLGLPDIDRAAALGHTLSTAAARSGLNMPGALAAAIVIVASLIAIGATVRRPRGQPGHCLLVLVVGFVVLITAAATPPIAAVALAPFVVLWWTAPLAHGERDRWARWVGVVYTLLALAAVAGLLLAGRAEPVSAAWPARASVIAALLLALGALVALRHVRRDGSSAALALAMAAVIAAGSLWLAPPQQLLRQRGFDRALAHTLRPLVTRPTAVLAPVGAPLWRAELGRPVFTARSLAGLCRWAAGQTGAQPPLALVRPGATDAVLARFANARLVAQSPGTPRTSVMVIELGSAAAHGCHAPD